MGFTDIKFNKDSVFLITGGAGFIGSNLCEAILNMGYKVVCLDNLSTGFYKNIEEFFTNSNFRFIKGDIRNYNTCYEACKGVNYVLHQAAWGSVPRSIKMPLLYEEINIKGTLNMLEAARQNNVKKFVYASSSSVYGDEPNLPKKEGQEGKLLSPYALTKKVNEEYAKMYTSLYGLETYGLRYFNVFGKKQNPNGPYAAVIPKFIFDLANNKRPSIYGDGTQSRDFTYINNVVEANLKACKSKSCFAGNAFNIAYGGQVVLMDLYKLLCKMLNKDIDPIFQSERPGDIKYSNADISKARECLKYNPRWDFETGISKSLIWYMDNLLLFEDNKEVVK